MGFVGNFSRKKSGKMKRKLVGITAVGLLGLVLLGGCGMIDKNQRAMKVDQDRAVKYIVQNYRLGDGSKISDIEFVYFKESKLPGGWNITAKVNKRYLITLTEPKLGGELRSSHYRGGDFIPDKGNESVQDVAIKYYKED